MHPFCLSFLSVALSSVDESGAPQGSYAPFVYDDGVFYIYISDIAAHARNLKRLPKVGLLFAEDEAVCTNIFARKRMSFQCDVRRIERESARFDRVLGLFEGRFDAALVRQLRSMIDFQLYALRPYSGEAVFGFGGAKMDQLIPRRGAHSVKK
ncbi:MAG: pyridoxamine 5'-phosphate oxidase family protein [Campylobacterales bacterium]|nr:pyridoxamine 5'-phosphate oxidase family protein [Campylobacterales bacterium]